MKILLTGATGLVGTALVKQLQSAGHDIHFLTTSKNKLSSDDNYKGFYWNPSQNEIDVQCIDDVEVIIHLAGANVSNRWSKQYKQEIIDSRTKSTSLLADLLKNNKHKVKHVINASAVGIYKDSLNVNYDESAEAFSDTFLGQVVQKWENAADVFQSMNIRLAKVRIGIVLSENGGAFVKMSQPIKMGVGAAFGSGKQWQSWISLDDLVSIFIFIMDKELEGVYNAVAPNPVTNKELTKAIAKHFKRPLFLPGIPKFMMQLILGEMHQILFESQKVNAEKIKSLGFEFKHPEIQLFLEK